MIAWKCNEKSAHSFDVSPYWNLQSLKLLTYRLSFRSHSRTFFVCWTTQLKFYRISLKHGMLVIQKFMNLFYCCFVDKELNCKLQSFKSFFHSKMIGFNHRIGILTDHKCHKVSLILAKNSFGTPKYHQVPARFRTWKTRLETSEMLKSLCIKKSNSIFVLEFLKSQNAIKTFQQSKILNSTVVFLVNYKLDIFQQSFNRPLSTFGGLSDC